MITCADERPPFMRHISRTRQALENRIVEGDGEASRSDRRAAFNNCGLHGAVKIFADKVARHAYRVTDEDFTDAKRSGISEDQLFEIAVCAAVGQATRQYETALEALAACHERK